MIDGETSQQVNIGMTTYFKGATWELWKGYQQASGGRDRKRTDPEQQEAIDFTTELQTDSHKDETGERRSVCSFIHTTPQPHTHTFPGVTGSPALTDP